MKTDETPVDKQRFIWAYSHVVNCIKLRRSGVQGKIINFYFSKQRSSA